MVDTVVLFRPVGKDELDLIEASGFKQFPPRLPEQPIFYPVLSEEYAIKIARDWNAKFNRDKIGFVTRFEVNKSFIDGYEVQVVGGSEHEEYWIPAEELSQFNSNIVGQIEVIAEFQNSE